MVQQKNHFPLMVSFHRLKHSTKLQMSLQQRIRQHGMKTGVRQRPPSQHPLSNLQYSAARS